MTALLESLRRQADLLAERARMGGDPEWVPVDTLAVELRAAGARLVRDWTRKTTPELRSAFEFSVVRLLLSAEAHHPLGDVALGSAVFLAEVGADVAKARRVAAGMRPDALAIYAASAIARPAHPHPRWQAAWVAALLVAGLERLAVPAAEERGAAE